MIFGNFIYNQCIDKIVAFNTKEFFEALEKIETMRNYGYLVGYIRYEAYQILLKEEIESNVPLLYFEFFHNRVKLQKPNRIYKNFYPKITKIQDYTSYAKQLSFIKSAIARGDTYQVNYTYRINLFTHCDAEDMFYDILENQKTPFCAYIANSYEEILCFSPELFFEINKKHINVKPMKGTIDRSMILEEDQKNKEFLSNDQKNRSENIMIVDLLRNDLSRIADEIRVTKLFEVITLKTLHQMISTVEATLKEKIKFIDILKALFPCGSITGAPKLKTMEIIKRLESHHRGVYCGMIGVIDREDMCFNVPIRTLIKNKKEKEWNLYVGSGVVWDSDIKAEYQESILKSKFIYPQIDFILIETMRVQNGRIKNFTLHKKRLLDSVRYFGFIQPNLEELSIRDDGLLRIEIDKNGIIKQEFKELVPTKNKQISIALRSVDKNNDFLYHKTSYAPWYQEARDRIRRGEIFDCIFYDKYGEISEGARSNIILQIDNRCYTPREESGILNGIMRQKLLKEKKIIQKALFLDDLKIAQKIFCINAIRGIVEVHLVNLEDR